VELRERSITSPVAVVGNFFHDSLPFDAVWINQQVLTPPTSAPRLGSPRPHLHRDCAHRSHICSGTGLLHRGWPGCRYLLLDSVGMRDKGAEKLLESLERHNSILHVSLQDNK
jgi:hypothetical protein